MKQISRIFLTVVLVCSIALAGKSQGVYSISPTPVCWSFSGVDSNLLSLLIFDIRDTVGLFQGYVNAVSGQYVNTSAGGTISAGYCCCGNSGTVSNVSITDNNDGTYTAIVGTDTTEIYTKADSLYTTASIAIGDTTYLANSVVQDILIAISSEVNNLRSETGCDLTITQASHGFAVGDLLTQDPNTGAYSLAAADTATNFPVAYVCSVVDVNNFKVDTEGWLTGAHGLTDWRDYFLQDTAGDTDTTAGTYQLFAFRTFTSTLRYFDIPEYVVSDTLGSSSPAVDSTRLTQDSILLYYQAGSEIGRDTIRLPGGGGGGSIDSTRLAQDSILVYYFDGVEVGRDTIHISAPINGISGTPNYFPFWQSDLTQPLSDTSSIYQDGTGRVGVGLTTPSQTLHVRNIGINEPLLVEKVSTLSAYESSMHIRKTKNGTLSSIDGPHILFQIGELGGSNFNIGTIGVAREGANNSGEIRFQTANVGTLSTVAVIEPSGEFGIGTTSPARTLDVTGTGRFTSNCTIQGTIWLNSGETLGIFHGTGTPEGAVSADVGSTFHRTDGGASTSYYVKESGTGNTGWVAK